MTANERLARLELLGQERLRAARRGELESVARLEAERRGLVAGLSPAELHRLAEDEPDALAERIRSILVNDSRLGELWRARLAAQGWDLADLARRRRAERAYRGI